MSAVYSPMNSSIEHLEFTEISQTVSIVDQPLQQWMIDEITGYTTSNQMTFDDLTWQVSSKSFSYSSLFEYAVLRKVYYTTLSDDQTVLNYGTAENIPLLPPIYDVLYQSDVPDESMTVTFHLKGQTRTGTESSGGGDGGDSGGSQSPTVIWSDWSDWEDDYTITITTNIDQHAKLLQQAASNSRLAKNSPTKPDWSGSSQ